MACGGTGVVDLHILMGVGAGVTEDTGIDFNVAKRLAITSESKQNCQSRYFLRLKVIEKRSQNQKSV